MSEANTTTYVTHSAASVLDVRGRDRVDLLHRLSTGDLRPLGAANRVVSIVSTLFTTNQGKVLDWSFVLARPDHLLVRTSPERAVPLAAWIEKFTIMEDVQTVDVSAAWSLIIVHGPNAAAVVGLPALPEPGMVSEHGGALWSLGLTAYGPRLEALVPTEAVAGWTERLHAAGAQRAAPRDLELWRILAGVPSPHHEFKEEVNPLELRLGRHAVSWNKGCYIGQEVISRLDSYNKVARLLMGFDCEAPIAPSETLKITRDGKPLGRVTSLMTGPDGRGCGLAVVKREAAEPGDAQLVTAGATLAIRLVDRPFWDHVPAV